MQNVQYYCQQSFIVILKNFFNTIYTKNNLYQYKQQGNYNKK